MAEHLPNRSKALGLIICTQTDNNSKIKNTPLKWKLQGVVAHSYKFTIHKAKAGM